LKHEKWRLLREARVRIPNLPDILLRGDTTARHSNPFRFAPTESEHEQHGRALKITHFPPAIYEF
jgi:hypothetical protein